MKHFILLLAVLASPFAQGADEVAWKKPYWAWGQGTSTNAAGAQAVQNTRPAIADLRGECDGLKGIVNVSAQYGTCTKSDDPYFCKHGCYSCPVYGTGTCTLDTTTTIKMGALVEALIDAELMSGSQVVGHVAKGDRFHVARINGQWASLDALDGTAVNGWIRLKDIQRL